MGMSLGAAAFGALVNFELHKRSPEDASLINQIMDPLLRKELHPEHLVHLKDSMSASPHHVYLFSIVLALFVFILCMLIPRGIGPSDDHQSKGH